MIRKLTTTRSSYGRECRPDFTCARGLDEAGEACKCPVSVGGQRCHSCRIAADGAVCLDDLVFEGGIASGAFAAGSSP